MSNRFQTTIDQSKSTVILLAHKSAYTTQLMKAIQAVHLDVEVINPSDLPGLVTKHTVRDLFTQSYVCLWLDIPIFVPQYEKEKENEETLAALQKVLHVPLHFVAFDTLYERKNGREGQVPTIASRILLTAVLKAFPMAECFLYSHVFYPYDGGISIVQRFLIEKIEQGKRFPLLGECTPLWYTDVISHIVTTLYDLSIKGGHFSGRESVSLANLEILLRDQIHVKPVSGKPIDFPFQFQTGKSIGEVSISTIVEEVSLIITTPAAPVADDIPSEPKVFLQQKRQPKQAKRRSRLSWILKQSAFVAIIGLGFYSAAAITFFVLLGSIRTTISRNVSSVQADPWTQGDIAQVLWKTQVLEKISSAVPLPYSLVGMQLPREGVVEGLASVSRFINAIQSYHEATELLVEKLQNTQSEAKTEQMNALLDESYKNLSAIQADISKGNPIFDSVFGMDGLSVQLVTSTISLRESITQKKAMVSLVASIVDAQTTSTVAVVSLDSKSARPLFGIPQEVALFTIVQGRVESTQTYTVEQLDQMLKGKVETPKEMQSYGVPADWKLSDGSWSVDGPTAAREMAWFISKQLHVDADTVIFIDTPSLMTAISSLENTTQLANSAAQSTVLGTTTMQTPLFEFMDKTNQASSDQLREILTVFSNSLNTSQAVLFSKDPSVEKAIHTLAWDGGVRTPPCPSPFTVDRECIVFTRYLAEYDVLSSRGGGAIETVQKDNQVHKLQISSQSITHTDIVTYPKDLSGSGHKILKYLVDADASVLSVAVNGQLLAPETASIGREFEKTSITFDIHLSSERQTEVSIVYTTPAIISKKSAVAFFVQKQAGKKADLFTLDVKYDKEYMPGIIAPKGKVGKSELSFTTSLDTSKIFAVGF